MLQSKRKQSNLYPIFNGEYELIRSLGEGAFAKVYHGRSIQDKKEVAIKVFNKEPLRLGKGSYDNFYNEILIL